MAGLGHEFGKNELFWSMGFSGTPKDMGPPKMVSGTHTTPIRIPKDMGPMVWVPLTIFGGPIIIGGPRSNPIDLVANFHGTLKRSQRVCP